MEEKRQSHLAGATLCQEVILQDRCQHPAQHGGGLPVREGPRAVQTASGRQVG